MRGRLLIAYSNASNHVATTAEYINSFAYFSGYEVAYLHVVHGARIDCDLDEFDAILHNYCARFAFPGSVNAEYCEKLKRYRGVKAMTVQDEYDWTDRLRDAIREHGFHVIFTCVPQAFIEQVYPRAQFPMIDFVSVLTGYVPEDVLDRGWMPRPLTERSTVIGYRGRDIGARYGQLAFDKIEIGRRMREICVERGIPHDIDVTEDKRVYGKDWYDFIESCRTVLGSESGSNVFDFDGSLAALYTQLTAKQGRPPSYDEFRQFTASRETQVDMGQISPRIFEAAALRTPLILFSGRYSDAIAPGEHYIELKRDFSNIDGVLAQLGDTEALDAMAHRTYQHLIASGRYSYRRFVALVDDAIERRRREIRFRAKSPKRRSSSLPEDPVPGEVLTLLPRHPILLDHRRMRKEYEALLEKYQSLWSSLERPSFLAKLMAAALLPKPFVEGLHRVKARAMPLRNSPKT